MNPRQGIETLRRCGLEILSNPKARRKTVNPRQGIETRPHRRNLSDVDFFGRKTVNPRQGIETEVGRSSEKAGVARYVGRQ